MSVSRVAVVLGFLVLCCLVYSQSKPTSSTVPAGYQLLAAQVTINAKGNSWDEHQVFLLDSTTGRVWELLPASLDKEGKFREASFQGVAVAPNP